MSKEKEKEKGLVYGELVAYVEYYVEYHPDSSEEEWIWMGRQPQDDHMRRQGLSGGSYENGDNNEIVANNGEEGVVDKREKEKNVVESSTIGFTASKSSKRGCTPPSDDSVFTDLFNQFKDIAVTLKEINRGPVDYTSLYSEVMATTSDGYSEDMLVTAFDHLCENKKAARRFLAKNAKLRKFWMDSYFFTRL
nr:hypothetical protein CFP56_06274 [Quercus suber]